MEPRKRLAVEEEENLTVITFLDAKILNDQTIEEIGKQLHDIADQVKIPHIIIDWKHVENIKVSILGKLITLSKRLKERGGRLVLRNVAQGIYEVFEIVKLDKLFHFQKDV